MELSTRALPTIPLSDLPRWSPWPARLLGLSEWQVPTRTIEKVDRQYDKDVYAKCLSFARGHPHVTAESVRAFELQLGTRSSICVSQHGTLYELPESDIIPVNNELLIETLAPFMAEVDVVVELGSGYGFNLWILAQRFPGKRYIGGEYSGNAVTLGAMLYANHPSITLQQFNYYDEEYDILEQCTADERILVLTRHSIEQLPSAESAVQALVGARDRLTTVVHLEVIHEQNDDSLLGLLRRSYTIANDYNRDLLTLLQGLPKEVEILRNEPDALGMNPLNPTSILIWRPQR